MSGARDDNDTARACVSEVLRRPRSALSLLFVDKAAERIRHLKQYIYKYTCAKRGGQPVVFLVPFEFPPA